MDKTIAENTTKNTNSNISIVLPHNFEPRDYQLKALEAFDKGYKRLFLRWSRRAGKDKFCINVIVKAAFEHVGMYFYIFPEYSQARKAVWEGRDKAEFKLLDHIPMELRTKTNNNEMKVELINGSIIRFVGSDNIDSLMGTNPLGIVLSEYAIQDPKAWEYLRPILAENGGWAIFQGTPRGKNHMYQMEQKNLTNPLWYLSEVQSLWPDLPNYYPVQTMMVLEEERRSGMTEEMLEQEYGASYIAGARGNYYSDQIKKARDDKRIGNFPYNDHLGVDTFWDLGWSDDTVIWFVQQDGNANIFIDYYESNTKDLAHYVQILKEKGYRYRTHYLPHDAAGGKLQSSMSHKDLLMRLCQSMGIGWDVMVAPRPGTKQFAIDAVRARFSTYFFNESKMSDALTKLSLYHRRWDKANSCFANDPVHDWCSHAADALTTEALTADMHESTYKTMDIVNQIEFDPLDY